VAGPQSQALGPSSSKVGFSERASGPVPRLTSRLGLGERRNGALLVHLVANGEQSGALAAMLERAAAELEREAERRLTWVAALIQPALIVAMGAIVLVLVLAVMLPIVAMNQLIR